MLNPDLRDLLKNNTSRYSLVIAVAKRARTIAEDPILNEKCGTEKQVTYALEEFLDGKLEIVLCAALDNNGNAPCKPYHRLIANVAGLRNDYLVPGVRNSSYCSVYCLAAANGNENFAVGIVGDVIFSFCIA